MTRTCSSPLSPCRMGAPLRPSTRSSRERTRLPSPNRSSTNCYRFLPGSLPAGGARRSCCPPLQPWRSRRTGGVDRRTCGRTRQSNRGVCPCRRRSDHRHWRPSDACSWRIPGRPHRDSRRISWLTEHRPHRYNACRRGSPAAFGAGLVGVRPAPPAGHGVNSHRRCSRLAIGFC